MERDAAITNFMNITGTDHKQAKLILESCKWDVNQAVSLHFAGSDASGNPGGGREEGTLASPGEEVRAAVPSKRMRLVTGIDPYACMDYNARDRVVNPFANYALEESARNHDGTSRGGGSKMGTSQRSFAQMYAPPRKLIYSGTFERAKAYASKTNRWLMVNIQDLKDFSSHRLNRDTWKDDIVRELIQFNCIFWQNDVSVPDGAKYMALYNVKRQEGIPHISVIDPVTGAKMWHLTGFVEPDVLGSKLSDFLDKFETPSGLSNFPPKAKGQSTATSIKSGGRDKLAEAQDTISPSALADEYEYDYYSDGQPTDEDDDDSDNDSDSDSDSDSGSNCSSDSDSSSSSSNGSDSNNGKDSHREKTTEDADGNVGISKDTASNMNEESVKKNVGSDSKSVKLKDSEIAAPLEPSLNNSSSNQINSSIQAKGKDDHSVTTSAIVDDGPREKIKQTDKVTAKETIKLNEDNVAAGGRSPSQLPISQMLTIKDDSAKESVIVVPREPASHEDVITVQIRFPDGKRVRRRFLADHQIVEVFHYAANELGLTSLPCGKELTITSYPHKSLVPLQQQTFREVGLKNSSLIVRLEG